MDSDKVARLPNTVKGSTRLRHATGWVYIIGHARGEPTKIGYSYSLDPRLKELQSAHWLDLIVHAAFEAADYQGAEAKLHDKFAATRIRREWFAWSDDLEAMIASLEEGCGRTLRHLNGTGHVRIGTRYLNFSARIAENNRKKANALKDLGKC